MLENALAEGVGSDLPTGFVRIGQFGDFYLNAKLYFLEDDLDVRITGGPPIGTHGARQSVQPGSREAAIQKIQTQFRETVEEIGSVAGGSPSAPILVAFYLLSTQYRRERMRWALAQASARREQVTPSVSAPKNPPHSRTGPPACACRLPRVGRGRSSAFAFRIEPP
jgi:hypothetical protein